jgi:two-component system sensor histidine kinase KdpD
MIAVVGSSIVDTIVRYSGEIDVYVISGDTDESRPLQPVRSLRRTSPWRAYAWGAAVVVACTLIARLLWLTFDLSNLIMVYLLGVVWSPHASGRVDPASILSVAADFFFVEPYLTFAVSDTQYVVTFFVMLLTALIISNLTVRFASRPKPPASARSAPPRSTRWVASLSAHAASTASRAP